MGVTMTNLTADGFELGGALMASVTASLNEPADAPPAVIERRLAAE